MSFTSISFLFVFLPILLCIYYLANDRAKEYVLLAASLAFYALGSLKYLVLFVILTAATVCVGRVLSSALHKVARVLLLILGICVNLIPLFYYKYFDFAIDTWNRVSGSDIQMRNLALPLGISFFTFKAISYVVDTYKGTIELKDRLVHDALYLSFFAQIQSGPLNRYGEMNCEMTEMEGRRYMGGRLFSDGVYRFMIGFSKKILLANMLAKIVDEVYATPMENFTTGYAWLGSICFSLQLFFDFSGYSDMAIGISEMFGYPCRENFIYPYITESVAKFWRRWHISLSEWFRDYVYIPLGGSRTKHACRVYFNLFVVWLLTGIWHGANWTFIAWGLGYFVLISFEKMTGWPDRFKTKFGKIIWRIISILFINIQWILFRSTNIRSALSFIKRLFICNYNELTNKRMCFLMKEYWVFIVVAVLLSMPIVPMIFKKTENHTIAKLVAEVIVGLIIVFAFIWSISLVLSGLNNPFAYANF